MSATGSPDADADSETDPEAKQPGGGATTGPWPPSVQLADGVAAAIVAILCLMLRVHSDGQGRFPQVPGECARPLPAAADVLSALLTSHAPVLKPAAAAALEAVTKCMAG